MCYLTHFPYYFGDFVLDCEDQIKTSLLISRRQSKLKRENLDFTLESLYFVSLDLRSL